MGTIAAVLGAALRVPVLAVDPLAGSAECARRFAELTSAEVEAHEASVSDLPDLLAGRIPTAIYGIGVLRYLQKHSHQDRATFSLVTALDAARRSASPTPPLQAVLEAARGADILALEVTCPDWLTELDAAARPMGYHIEVPKPGRLPMVVTDDEQVMATLAMTSSQNEVSTLDLLDGYSGYEADADARRLGCLFGGHAPIGGRRDGPGLVAVPEFHAGLPRARRPRVTDAGHREPPWADRPVRRLWGAGSAAADAGIEVALTSERAHVRGRTGGLAAAAVVGARGASPPHRSLAGAQPLAQAIVATVVGLRLNARARTGGGADASPSSPGATH